MTSPGRPESQAWRYRYSLLHNNFFFLILFRAINSFVTGAFFESHWANRVPYARAWGPVPVTFSLEGHLPVSGSPAHWA